MDFNGTLTTDRLLLRRWRPGDLEPFAALNSDPEVMRYFPYPLSTEQTEIMIKRIEVGFEEENFGLWAVELKSNGAFIGSVGLCRPSFDAFFTPCVEIGWRLAKEYWGQGYASEAARATMLDGFERCGLDEIVSFTAVVNENSMKVMQKLGMKRDPDEDFHHPRLAKEHPLSHHVLYRLKKSQWQINGRS